MSTKNLGAILFWTYQEALQVNKLPEEFTKNRF